IAQYRFMNEPGRAAPIRVGLRQDRDEYQPRRTPGPFLRKVRQIQILPAAAAPIKPDGARVSAHEKILDDGFDRCEAGPGRETNDRPVRSRAQIEFAEGNFDVELVAFLQSRQYAFGKL